jgi:hypothetical protein
MNTGPKSILVVSNSGENGEERVFVRRVHGHGG